VSDAIIIIDSSLNIVFSNPSGKELLNYSKGTDIFDKTNLKKIIGSEQKKGIRLEIKGRIFKLDIITMDDKEQLIFLIREDIKHLQIDKEVFEEIFEESADGLVCIDSEGIFTKINKAYAEIIGIDREDYLGKPAELIRERGFLSKIVTPLVLKDKEKRTINVKERDKEILITGLPIFNNKGELIRVVANIRDMTELKNLQDKVYSYKILNERYRSELSKFRHKEMNATVIAKSTKMQDVLDRAIRSAQIDANVIICGESGTGKEVIAKVIHRASPRSEGPFIAINCGAIPENLLESELFGYERGAFTGANHTGKIGLFEVAQDGTLFLDEITSLPLNLQVKLLRVIQEKEFRRLGGKKNIHLNVRFIAATNQDIQSMVTDGAFRDDLYYRLNVINITIPPLRERPEDIAALVTHFTCYFNKKYHTDLSVSSPRVLEELLEYDWPGNVRELENAVESMIALGQENFLESKFIKNKAVNPMDLLGGEVSLADIIHETEKNIIINVYQKEGSTRRAARKLGVDQSTVVRKLHKYGYQKLDS
jgi:PAS domain S-box-containing protein/TyrR family helix-turn-helix protein